MTHPAQKQSAVDSPVSETAADRRREKRFSSQRATASLFLRDQDHAAPVQVVDVSRDGMGLRLGMQVAVGSLVEVWLENFGVKGTIRFCRPTEDGAYDAGLEILSDLEGKAPPPFPAESDALSVGQLSTQPQSLRSTEGPARAHITVRMEFGAQAAIDCILLGIADGYMHVSAECGIMASTSLTARFNQVAVLGEVVYCMSKDDHYRICIRLNSNRVARGEPRFPLSDACTAVILNREVARLSGCLTDIAGSGLGLLLDGPIAPDSILYVETRSLLIVGEARHCRQTGDGSHVVGVRITDILLDVDRRVRAFRTLPLRHKLAEFILGRPIEGSGANSSQRCDQVKFRLVE